MAVNLHKMPIPSSRLRRYYLGEQFAVEVLGMMRGWPEFFALPVIRNLPPAAVVQRIYHEPARRGFMVLVWHPSFDVVPDGEEIPVAPDSLIVETGVLRRQADGSYRVMTVGGTVQSAVKEFTNHRRADGQQQADFADAVNAFGLPVALVEGELADREAESQAEFFRKSILAE